MPSQKSYRTDQIQISQIRHHAKTSKLYEIFGPLLTGRVSVPCHIGLSIPRIVITGESQEIVSGIRWYFNFIKNDFGNGKSIPVTFLSGMTAEEMTESIVFDLIWDTQLISPKNIRLKTIGNIWTHLLADPDCMRLLNELGITSKQDIIDYSQVSRPALFGDSGTKSNIQKPLTPSQAEISEFDNLSNSINSKVRSSHEPE